MKQRILIVLLFIFLASACVPSSNIQSSDTPTQVVSTTPIPNTIKTLPASITSVQSATPTSFVPQLSITLTPFLNQSRIEWLYINPPCIFPCWWGIIPGITMWEDGNNLLNFLGINIKDELASGYTKHQADMDLSENSNYATSLDLYEKDGTIQYLSLSSMAYPDFLPVPELRKRWESFEPANVFRNFGIPSRIYLQGQDYGPVDYFLSLVYDEKGFMISYSGSAIVTSSGIRGCPSFATGGIYFVAVNIQSPTSPWKIEEFPAGDILGFKSIFPTLDKSTNLSIDEFINLFIGDQPTFCFTLAGRR